MRDSDVRRLLRGDDEGVGASLSGSAETSTVTSSENIISAASQASLSNALALKENADTHAKAGQYADANAKYGQVLVALNRVFPWTQETDGGGGGGGVGGETISASGERKKVKTLTATVLSNRALTCRRLGQHASALEDACKADCLLAEFGLEAELGLRIKTKYAMGESLAHLGRPVEACDVLRQAMRLVETMKKEQDEEKNEQTSCDVAGLVSCLRRAARSLPMSYVASHWADAICSGESVSFLSPNPREGNLLKPIRPAAMRATKAEIARRLLDATVGNENRWRERTVDAWVFGTRTSSSCVGKQLQGGTDESLVGDTESHSEGCSESRVDDTKSHYSTQFPFGTGNSARCVLHYARASVYRAKGNAEQFLKDATFSVAYATAVPKRSVSLSKASASLKGYAKGTSATVSSKVSSSLLTESETAKSVVSRNAVLAGETHALLATAYATIFVLANRGTPTDTASTQSSATRHFLDKKEDAIVVHKPSPSLDSSKSSGAKGRVVLAVAGTLGAKTDDLIVDAGVASAVQWKRALESDPDFDGSKKYEVKLQAACDKFLVGFGSELVTTLTTKGSDAALRWLETDKWAHAPEYVRTRPKYYYFFEMMRGKIEAHYPALPEPVMDKLLSTDADELDLLCQYPEAIRGQTEEYLAVFHEHGANYLGTYKTPTLTWDEVKALKGGDGVVGLGALGETVGAPMTRSGDEKYLLASAKKKMDAAKAFGDRYQSSEKILTMLPELPIEEEEEALDAASDDETPELDTDKAMIGASGEDGLTRAEEIGLPKVRAFDSKEKVFTTDFSALPPDQRRAHLERHASTTARLTEEWTFVGKETKETQEANETKEPVTSEEEPPSASQEKCARFQVQAMDEMD